MFYDTLYTTTFGWMNKWMLGWNWNFRVVRNIKIIKSTTVSVADSVLYSAIKQSYKEFSGERWHTINIFGEYTQIPYFVVDIEVNAFELLF